MNEYVQLISQDGFNFYINKKVAQLAENIKSKINSKYS